MNAYERVMTALSHQEPDYVPVFILLTMHGAKELGLSLEDYFSKGSHIAEAQIRLQAKYGYDCVYAMTYAACEAQAFGSEVLFYDDGPPNITQPALRPDDIPHLEVPDPTQVPILRERLRAIELLAERLKGKVPILAGVVGAFSLPILLMGFQDWLDLLLYGDPERRERLLAVTGEFCVAWANAQLAAGADALGYFDAVATATIITREQFMTYALPITQRTIARIKGPVAYCGASGTFGPFLDLIPQTGAIAMMVSAMDDLAACKAAVGQQLSLMGNLNNVAMLKWTPAQAEEEVRRCLEAAARGGGYILCDQHGEFPYYVSEEIIAAIVEAARKWGKYIHNHG